MNKTKIAAALRLLADAIEEPEVATDPKTPAKKTPAQDQDEQVNEPEIPAHDDEQTMVDDPPAEDDTVDEVTLEDLQEIGASLLRAKKRDAFVKVLGQFKIKNLSAASSDDYKAIWDALTKAGE
jgi:hypothetical protein